MLKSSLPWANKGYTESLDEKKNSAEAKLAQVGEAPFRAQPNMTVIREIPDS